MSLRSCTLGVWCLLFLATQCWGAPANDDRPQIIEIIAPAQAAQETLDSLNLGEPNYEQSDRNKRTIGMLRDLFPELSKIIDQKVQEIAKYLVRVAGPTIISGLLGNGGLFGGGGGGGEGGSSDAVSGSVSGSFSDDDDDDSDKNISQNRDGSKVSISLPTFPPDAIGSDTSDDDDDNNASVAEKSKRKLESASLTLDDSYKPNVGLNPRFSNEINSSPSGVSKTSESEKSNFEDDGPISLKLSLATEGTVSQSSQRDVTTATSGVNPEENNLDAAESQQQEVRVEFDESVDSDSKVRTARKSDQIEAASDNNEALDDLTIENSDTNEENRDKRLVSFGFGNGASSGGSGGGSGNFLFDIVRLVAGSGGTEQTDDTTNAAAAEGEVGKGDGYTEGIPGPVTRLFIIANRGISNLIQDLILRIAQTSERLVNFKARLITSII